MTSIKQKEGGFTIIELIIALAIFASVSIMSYKAINQLIKSNSHIYIENQKWQQFMLFFDRFETDIRHHIDRPIRNKDDQIEPAWYGTPYLTGEYGVNLAFSRLGEIQGNDFLMDSRRVGYRLKNGSIETLIWPVLDLAPSSKPEIFKLLDNVADFSIDYLNENGRWSKTWPNESMQLNPTINYPRAILISVVLNSGESVVRVFSL